MIDPHFEILNHAPAAAFAKLVCICAGIAAHNVVSKASDNQIETRTVVNCVIVAPAEEAIVTRPTIDEIVAARADNEVIAIVAMDFIVSIPGIFPVIAMIPVIVNARVDHVVPPRA